VLFEIAIDFGSPCRIELLPTPGAAVGKAIGLGDKVVQTPPGTLSQRPEIDHVSHVASQL